MAILEVSKLHACDFYHDVLKERYGDEVRFAYSDTGRHILKAEAEYVYDDFKILVTLLFCFKL